MIEYRLTEQDGVDEITYRGGPNFCTNQKDGTIRGERANDIICDEYVDVSPYDIYWNPYGVNNVST